MYTFCILLNCLVGRYLNLGIGRYFNDHLVSHFIFGEIKAEFVSVCSFNKNFLSTGAGHCVGLIPEGCHMPHELLLLPPPPVTTVYLVTWTNGQVPKKERLLGPLNGSSYVSSSNTKDIFFSTVKYT